MKMSPTNFPYLKEFVYGGIDGCVTTFAIVAGATGIELNSGIILVLGFANLFADGFSMSVGNYLSVKSEIDRDQNAGQSTSRLSPLQTSGATFVSFIVMGSVPLSAYVLSYAGVLRFNNLFLVSSTLTASAFVLIGLLRSYITKASIVMGILETLLLGGIAAVIAYYVGNVLERIL